MNVPLNAGVPIVLSDDEAIVLFELLRRYTESEVLDIVDQAEQRALWNLCCVFEKTGLPPFDGDYADALRLARERLSGMKATGPVMAATADQFCKAALDLSLKLRSREIPPMHEFIAMHGLLHALGMQYAARASLPKALVGLLLDLSTALYSAADAIEEPGRGALYAQFDIVCDKIRDICA